MSLAAQNVITREFVFTTADFERIRKLIRENAGIALAPSKQEMVYSRLARRLRARGLARFSEYVALLDGSDPAEWEAFVNSLTTNLTSFFREAHHFAALAAHVERLRRERRRDVNVWCCAASTGEEPYSIAMTLADAYGTFTPPVTIIATDVDTNVLAKAEAGVYSAERVAKLTPDQLRRFFVRDTGGEGESTYGVRPELRRLVTFRQVNLLEQRWPIRGPLDAVFCRNVMIYFDKVTQRRILQRFVPLLQPDALLFAGHSESFMHSGDLFRLRGSTVYELASAAAR
jgi:chemotaxis protein methyltransferase CheR